MYTLNCGVHCSLLFFCVPRRADFFCSLFPTSSGGLMGGGGDATGHPRKIWLTFSPPVYIRMLKIRAHIAQERAAKTLEPPGPWSGLLTPATRDLGGGGGGGGLSRSCMHSQYLAPPMKIPDPPLLQGSRDNYTYTTFIIMQFHTNSYIYMWTHERSMHRHMHTPVRKHMIHTEICVCACTRAHTHLYSDAHKISLWFHFTVEYQSCNNVYLCVIVKDNSINL